MAQLLVTIFLRYTVSKRNSPQPLRPALRSKLYIFFPNNIVSVEKEVLIFDSGALLSAIGGYLGLFLGLSCFSLCQWIFNGVKILSEMVE